MARRGSKELAALVRKLGAPAVAEALGAGTSTIWRWIKDGPAASRVKDIERLSKRKVRPAKPKPKLSIRRQLDKLAIDIGAQLIGQRLRLPTTLVAELLSRPREFFEHVAATAASHQLRVPEREMQLWLRKPERIRHLIRQIGIKRTAARAGVTEDAVKTWLRQPGAFVGWAVRAGVERLAKTLDVTVGRVQGWQRTPTLLREYVRTVGLEDIARRQEISPSTVRDWLRRDKLPDSAREGVRKISGQREKGRKATASRKEKERRKREQARAAAEARKEKEITRIVEAETRVDDHMDWSFEVPRPKSTLDPEETKPTTHPIREDKKRAIDLPPLKQPHQVFWPDVWKKREPGPEGAKRRGRRGYIPIDLPPFELEWMKRRRAVYGHTFSYLDSEHFGKQIDEITPTGRETGAVRDLARMIMDARDSHERTKGAVIGVYVEAHRWIPDHAGYHVDSDIGQPVVPEYEHKILNWHVEPHGNLNIITNERELINQLTSQLSTLHEKNATRFLVLQALRVRFYTGRRRRAAA